MNSISIQRPQSITTSVFEAQEGSYFSSFTVERSISTAERIADGNANQYRLDESSMMREGKVRDNEGKHLPQRVASVTPIPLPKGCRLIDTQNLVNCNNAGIGDKGLEQLAKLLTNGNEIVEFLLENNNITSVGIEVLSEAIKNNTWFKLLFLNNNSIGDAGAQELGKMLKSNTVLFVLSLNSNQIGDAGVKALSKGLKHNHNSMLWQLGLRSNQIGDAGAQALGKMLKHNTALENLYLENNQIGDVGAQALGEGLKNNTALYLLSLGDNPISKAKCIELQDSNPNRAISCSKT